MASKPLILATIPSRPFCQRTLNQLHTRDKEEPQVSAFRDTHFKQLTLSQLIVAAQKMRATTLEEARGTCLATSLDFCQLAQQVGVPVQLVMWPIKNEPVFCDHWAVRISQTQVIDLTWIQIDATMTAEVVFKLTDYPANFQVPRFYQTAPLLKEYTAHMTTAADKLSPTLIKKLRWLMLRQDLDSVNHFEKYVGIFSALKSYCKFRIYFFLNELKEKLEKRRDSIADD